MLKPPEKDSQSARQCSIGTILVRIVLTYTVDYIPLAIGLLILYMSRYNDSRRAVALGLFVSGLTGVLRIMPYGSHAFQNPDGRVRRLGNIFFTLLFWCASLYTILR